MHTAKVPHISYMHMIKRSFETEEARVSRVKSGDATSRPNSVCRMESNGLSPFQTCLTMRSPLRPQLPCANTCNGVPRKCVTSGCSHRCSLRGSSAESGRSGIIAKTCRGYPVIPKGRYVAQHVVHEGYVPTASVFKPAWTANALARPANGKYRCAHAADLSRGLQSVWKAD